MKSTKYSVLSIFLLAIVLVFSIQAHADLILLGTATYNSSDYNLIYDDDLEITWLDYSNAKTNWQNQVDWAAGLNTEGVLTYNFNFGVTMNWSDDWRLPSALNQDGSGQCGVGFNCTESEMGHLYYTELGGSQNMPPSNTSHFQQLASGIYWYGTSWATDPTSAWKFDISNGYQGLSGKVLDGFYGIAIRPGLAIVLIPCDCNSDGLVDAGDISAVVLEIFDGDGNLAADTPGGTFSGNAVGCDANGDGIVDAGDISCTVLNIFNGQGACGGGATPASGASATSGEPVYSVAQTGP